MVFTRMLIVLIFVVDRSRHIDVVIYHGKSQTSIKQIVRGFEERWHDIMLVANSSVYFTLRKKKF